MYYMWNYKFKLFILQKNEKFPTLIITTSGGYMTYIFNHANDRPNILPKKCTSHH